MNIETRLKMIQRLVEKSIMSYNERQAFEQVIEILEALDERTRKKT